MVFYIEYIESNDENREANSMLNYDDEKSVR